jgi:hypothetical protein
MPHGTTHATPPALETRQEQSALESLDMGVLALTDALEPTELIEHVIAIAPELIPRALEVAVLGSPLIAEALQLGNDGICAHGFFPFRRLFDRGP